MVYPLEVGDLWLTSPRRRRIAPAGPFAGMARFAITVYFGRWWLTPLVMFAIFVVVVTVTHNVVHRALGLGPRGTDDPEGCYGPVFRARRWWRAWRTERDRARPAIEAVVPILALAAGVLSLTSIPGILVYVTMAIAGSRPYPQVPSRNLPGLGRRLDPDFAASGAKPLRVP